MKTATSIIFITLVLLFSNCAQSVVNVLKFVNHTAAEIKRNQAAVAKIDETINGQCFKDEWLKRELIQTNNKPNYVILSEFLISTIDVELEMYRQRFSGSIGYTYPTTKRIWMNRKYHDHMGPCDVGANLAHEALGHKLGFGHDFKATKRRNYSVPYSVGYLIEKCCVD